MTPVISRRLRSISIAILILVFVLIGLLMSGCGVNYHLKRAKHHTEKAIAKGAIIDSDTILKPITFTAPAMEFKTKIGPVPIKELLRDTIYVPGKSGIAKVKIDTITKHIYVECPEQSVTKNTAVAVNNTVKTPHGFWYFLPRIGGPSLLLGAAVILLLGIRIRDGPGGKFTINLRSEKPPV
jgi:hypothetical protein